MDLLTILLPGALLTFVLLVGPSSIVLADQVSKLAGGEAFADFLLVAYLVGHLVFLLGSWLDEFYDWARRYMRDAQYRTAGPTAQTYASRRIAFGIIERRCEYTSYRADLDQRSRDGTSTTRVGLARKCRATAPRADGRDASQRSACCGLEH